MAEPTNENTEQEQQTPDPTPVRKFHLNLIHDQHQGILEGIPEDFETFKYNFEKESYREQLHRYMLSQQYKGNIRGVPERVDDFSKRYLPESVEEPEELPEYNPPTPFDVFNDFAAGRGAFSYSDNQSRQVLEEAHRATADLDTLDTGEMSPEDIEQMRTQQGLDEAMIEEIGKAGKSLRSRYEKLRKEKDRVKNEIEFSGREMTDDDRQYISELSATQNDLMSQISTAYQSLQSELDAVRRAQRALHEEVPEQSSPWMPSGGSFGVNVRAQGSPGHRTRRLPEENRAKFEEMDKYAEKLRGEIEELQPSASFRVEHAMNTFARTLGSEIPASLLEWGGILAHDLENATESLGPVHRMLGGDPSKQKDIEDYALWQYGQKLRDAGESAFPGDPTLQREFVETMIPAAVASLTSFAGGGLAVRALGGSAGAFAGTAAAAGGSTQAYRTAKDYGATEEEAQTAARWGVIPGAIQVFPVIRILDRFDKASGGQIRMSVGNVFRQGFTGALEEGIVEGLGAVGQQAIRDVYMEEGDTVEALQEIAENSGAGAIGGFIASMIFTMAGGRRAPNLAQRRITPERTEEDSPGEGPPPDEGTPPSPPTEPTAPEGELAPEMTVEWDSGAPVEQQVNELTEQREMVQQARDEMDAAGEDVSEFDQMLTALDQQIGELGREMDTVTPVEEVQAPEAQPTQPAGLLPEITQTQQQNQQQRTDLSTQGTLGQVLGTQVEYEGYTGELTTDNEGNFVIETADGALVEIQDSRKDPDASLEDLGVRRSYASMYNFELTDPEAGTFSLSRPDPQTGEEVSENFTFSESNANSEGEVVSVTMINEQGEERTFRNPAAVEQIIWPMYFNENPGLASQIEAELGDTTPTEGEVTPEGEAPAEAEFQAPESYILDDGDPRINTVFEAFDNETSLTAQQQQAALEWINEKTDEIAERNPANQSELISQLEQFENEVVNYENIQTPDMGQQADIDPGQDAVSVQDTPGEGPDALPPAAPLATPDEPGPGPTSDPGGAAAEPWRVGDTVPSGTAGPRTIQSIEDISGNYTSVVFEEGGRGFLPPKETYQERSLDASLEDGDTNSVVAAYNRHQDDFDYTVQDLADDVEFINEDLQSEDIRQALEDFREAQRYDTEVSGRGDMDAAEDALIQAIEQHIRSAEPTALEQRGIGEDNAIEVLDGNYRVWTDEAGDLQVFSERAGRTVSRRSNNFKQAEAEYYAARWEDQRRLSENDLPPLNELSLEERSSFAHLANNYATHLYDLVDGLDNAIEFGLATEQLSPERQAFIDEFIAPGGYFTAEHMSSFRPGWWADNYVWMRWNVRRDPGPFSPDIVAEIIEDRYGVEVSQGDVVDMYIDFYEGEFSDQPFNSRLGRELTDKIIERLPGMREDMQYDQAFHQQLKDGIDARLAEADQSDLEAADSFLNNENINEADILNEDGSVNFQAVEQELNNLAQSDPEFAAYQDGQLSQEQINQLENEQSQQRQQPADVPPAQEGAQATPPEDSPAPGPQAQEGRAESLEQRRTELEAELDAISQQMYEDGAGRLAIGLDPKMIAQSARFIAKGLELGFVRFQQFAQRIIDNFGVEYWNNIFDSFKFAYIQKMRNQGNPNNEDLSAIENSSAQDYVAPTQEQTDPGEAPVDTDQVNRFELEQRLETEEQDLSDNIQRRLRDARNNEEVNAALEDMGQYLVQSREAANREANGLIRTLQEEMGDFEGLMKGFELLQDGHIPPLMVGPMAEKIGMRLQSLGRNAEGVEVYDWLQEWARDIGRGMVSLRSDASPESTVSRAFAGLEKAKQEAMEQESPKGESWQDLFDKIITELEKITPRTEATTESRQQIVDTINEILTQPNETSEQQSQREAAAEKMADAYIEGEQDSQLSDTLAEIADFEALTPDQKARIQQMTQDLAELMDQGKKELAASRWGELMDFLNRLNLFSRPMHELIFDLWYTGVMSGWSTIARSHFGSSITATAHTITRLLSSPRAAPLALSQMLKGFKGGLDTYRHVLETGYTDVQFEDFKPETPRFTDQLMTSTFKELGIPKGIMKGIMHYPTTFYRTILAWDTVGKLGLSEGFHALYEFDDVVKSLDHNASRREVVKEVRKRLAIDFEAQAAEQAADEVADMKERGEKIPRGYEQRRTREIVREKQNQEYVLRSHQEAAEALLVGQPAGFLGTMYQNIQDGLEISNNDPVPLQLSKYAGKGLAPFLRVAFNYTNAGLDYVPPIGLVRGWKSTRSRIRGDENRTVSTTGERRSHFLRASIGAALYGYLLNSIFDFDEEDGFKVKPPEERWIDITGPGTGNFWESQDISLDFKEWSIAIRKPWNGEWTRYYTYEDNPIGFVLAPIGIMSDQQKHNHFKAEARGRDIVKENKGMKYLLGSGMMGVFNYSMDQSFNQGIQALARLSNSNTEAQMTQNLYQAFGRPIEGFYPGLYRQTYQQYRALMDIPEKESNTWYENIAKAAPFADAIIKNEAYDVFGYPIIRDFDFPLFPEMVLKQAKDNLNYRETLPEWQLLHKYDQVTIGGFLPPSSHDGKRLTADQQNLYKEEAGLRFREMVSGNESVYRQLNEMDALELQKTLTRIKNRAARTARNVIFEGIDEPMSTRSREEVGFE